MVTQTQGFGSSQGEVRGAALGGTATTSSVDAIELLKSDHRQVEGWFADFDTADDLAEKQEIADSICHALSVHTQIEEELFYPAFLRATGDDELFQTAMEEHDEAKDLIEEMEAESQTDAWTLEAQVRELRDMIRHHVQDEEQPGGMFDKAAHADIDLRELGAELERRKLELMDDEATDEGYDEAVSRDDDT